MPVVCSCMSCCCYRYPQQEKSTLSPTIREVGNEKELTKTASVTDPAALLSPTSHHHSMNTTRATTTTRTPYYSSRCHHWEMSRRREPSNAIVYHRHTSSSQPSRSTAAIVFCAPAYAPAQKSRRENRKEEPDNQIAVVECFSVEPFLSSLPFTVLVYVCAPSVFFRNWVCNYINTREHCFPL